MEPRFRIDELILETESLKTARIVAAYDEGIPISLWWCQFGVKLDILYPRTGRGESIHSSMMHNLHYLLEGRWK